MSSISRISPVEELAEFLARRPSLTEIEAFQLSEATLARARELMDKNQDGSLSPEESRELDQLVLLDDIIGLIQVRATLARTSEGERAGEAPNSSPA